MSVTDRLVVIAHDKSVLDSPGSTAISSDQTILFLPHFPFFSSLCRLGPCVSKELFAENGTNWKTRRVLLHHL